MRVMVDLFALFSKHYSSFMQYFYRLLHKAYKQYIDFTENYDIINLLTGYGADGSVHVWGA